MHLTIIILSNLFIYSNQSSQFFVEIINETFKLSQKIIKMSMRNREKSHGLPRPSQKKYNQNVPTVLFARHLPSTLLDIVDGARAPTADYINILNI